MNQGLLGWSTPSLANLSISLLDYAPTADVIALTALAGSTWTDVTTNQTFTVTDPSANIWVFVAGASFSDGNTGTRINVDSAGTPITRAVGSGISGNPFSGAMPICLGPLGVGSHTIKVQAFTTVNNNRIRIQSTTIGPTEFIEIRVRQSRGL